MQAGDVIIAAAAVSTAIVAQKHGVTPEWVSHLIAAGTGSGLAAGFRLLDGQIKGWRAGVLAFAGGALAGYYAADLIVRLLKLDNELTIPLTFFVSTVGAVAIRSLATRLNLDGAVDAVEDKIEEKIKGV